MAKRNVGLNLRIRTVSMFTNFKQLLFEFQMREVTY